MSAASTTIRVSRQQHELLRSLASARGVSMTVALDGALEALRRVDFYTRMVAAEQELQQRPDDWAAYVAERDEWLESDLLSA